MIKSIFNHFPKDLLLGYSHNTLGLVHSFSNKKELPSEKQPVLEFAKQKQLVDDAQKTPKSKQETSQLKKAPKNIVFGKRKINKFPKEKQLIQQLIQLHKNQQKKSTRNILGIAGIIATVVGVYLTYQSTGYAFEGLHFTSKSDKRQEEKTDEYKWGKLREQHLKDFDKNTDFVDGKSVENQIRSIIQNKQNTLELILGVQGIGKTSAVKKLISEKRLKANKERIYYIHLRTDQQKDDPHFKSKQKIQKMGELINAIYQQYDGSVPTTLVIDDINKLEDQQDKIKRVHKQDQIIDLSRKGVKVILISSSTGFYHNIWVNELFRKYMNKREHIIWMMEESQAKQILQKRGSQLKINQKIIQKVSSFGLPLRKSIAILVQIPKWEIKQQKEVLKKLQDKFQGLKKQVVDQLKGVFFRNNINKEAAYQILNGLTKNKIDKNEDVQSVNKKNCFALYEKVDELEKQKMLPSFAIKELDKENLIIMCYPRSGLIMKAFEEKLKQLKKELNK